METVASNTKYRWIAFELYQKASIWCQRMRRRMRTASEYSSWWSFIWYWKSHITAWLQGFRSGCHRFSPMMQYKFSDEVIQVWSYLDCLMLHLILKIIKPTFKHVISQLCMHLKGPCAIKYITQDIKAALNIGRYSYCLRLDIRSYYASIDHRLLLNQLYKHYDDPILHHYFEAIVTTGVDCGGQVILPKCGIPIRSSLSPFFGALYLADLDRAFEKCQNSFYRRYMDDIIILVENKRQYTKARKRVFKILKELKLKISPHKSRMGKLKGGFHFLGCNFGVSRNPQRQTQVATVNIHDRSCRRALDKVQAMRQDAVHPVNIQRYLLKWATWWQTVTQLEKYALIYKWVRFAEYVQHSSVWLGQVLLCNSPYYIILTVFSNQNQKAY
jgi:RNA-directed DNA polymerase